MAVFIGRKQWLLIRNKSLQTNTTTLIFFFFVDRRNGKTIINSHTQVEVLGFEPRHDIRPNNFGILPVELGLLDWTTIFGLSCIKHYKLRKSIFNRPSLCSQFTIQFSLNGYDTNHGMISNFWLYLFKLF